MLVNLTIIILILLEIYVFINAIGLFDFLKGQDSNVIIQSIIAFGTIVALIVPAYSAYLSRRTHNIEHTPHLNSSVEWNFVEYENKETKTSENYIIYTITIFNDGLGSARIIDFTVYKNKQKLCSNCYVTFWKMLNELGRKMTHNVRILECRSLKEGDVLLAGQPLHIIKAQMALVNNDQLESLQIIKDQLSSVIIKVKYTAIDGRKNIYQYSIN